MECSPTGLQRNDDFSVGATIAEMFHVCIRPTSAREPKRNIMHRRKVMIHAVVATDVLDGPNNQTIFIERRYVCRGPSGTSVPTIDLSFCLQNFGIPDFSLPF